MGNFNLDLFKEEFEKLTVDEMIKQNIPGLSVAVVKDGMIIYERGFGARDRKGNQTATPETIYGIASITKSFTCLAIMQLQQAGKLNIDDPVSNYIPLALVFEDSPILIKHLMSHSSGIPSLGTYGIPFKNEKILNIDYPNIPLSNWQDFYFHVNTAKDEVTFRPGEKFHYFNGGFTMLSDIVKKVSEMPFEEYVETYILQPLGMSRSTFDISRAENDPDTSMGYDFSMENGSVERDAKNHTHGMFVSGPGGMLSSVTDLCQYVLATMNSGIANGNAILDPELLKQMQEPAIAVNDLDWSMLGVNNLGYGFGWSIIGDFFGYKIVRHSGSSGLSGGKLAFIPELKLGIVILYNVAGMSDHILYGALATMIGKDPHIDVPFFARKEHYEKLSGKYSSYRKLSNLEVENLGGQLFISGTMFVGSINLPLYPVNDDILATRFYYIAAYGRIYIEFYLDDDNKVSLKFERWVLHKQ